MRCGDGLEYSNKNALSRGRTHAITITHIARLQSISRSLATNNQQSRHRLGMIQLDFSKPRNVIDFYSYVVIERFERKDNLGKSEFAKRVSTIEIVWW